MAWSSLLPWNWGSRTQKQASVNEVRAAARHAARSLMARYDAAQTTSANTAHWSMADGMSANAANSKSVRETLRNRSRYECANNCYARGIVQTVANQTIGSGPRLQLRTGNKEADKKIKRSVSKWMKEIRLSEKLRTLIQSRVGDGEGLGAMITNPILKHSVKLDLRLFEAEMCTSKYGIDIDSRKLDGIDLDEWGNVKTYYVLKYHPGDTMFTGDSWDPVPYDASQIIHLFKAVRPQQMRGVPEITPALPLFALLRRYTLAVISAAEVAALISVYLKTTGIATPDSITAWTDFDLPRNAGLVLPDGWEMNQFTPTQPITTYKEFKTEILNEIARCVDMPLNIAAGNSNEASFSSGKIDHLTYGNMIKIDRQQIEDVVLDRLLMAFLEEAILIEGLIPDGLPPFEEWDWEWHWDAMSVGDALKEEQAIDTRLRNGTSSIPHELNEQGYDWESVIESQAEFFEVDPKEMKDIILKSLYSSGIPAPVDPESADQMAQDATKSIKSKMNKAGLNKKKADTAA